MAMTSTERARKWRARHAGFGRAKRELTMRRIFVYLYEHGDTQASVLYRSLHGHRDRASWRWLMGEIHNNFMHDDSLAPVTQIGAGRRGDPVILRTSEAWDNERDWDKEQEEIASGLRVFQSRDESAKVTRLAVKQP